jgi:hypothetical protein
MNYYMNDYMTYRWQISADGLAQVFSRFGDSNPCSAIAVPRGLRILREGRAPRPDEREVV